MDAKKFTKFQSELAGLILEGINKDEFKDGKDQATEEIAKLKEDNIQFKAAIEEMKKAAGKKVDLVVPGTTETKSFMYKGYNLTGQGLELGLPEDRKETIAKFLIDVVTKTAMTEASAGGGGYLVPDEYENELLALARLSSVALQDCRIWTMGGDTLRIPAEGNAVTVDFATAEADPNNQSEPTFSEVVLSPKRMGAYSIASNELLEDSVIDITSYLTEIFAEANGQKIDLEVFNGTNFTSDIHGNCGNTISGSGAYTAVTYTDFANAIAQLESIRRVGAKFYMDKALAYYVRTMKDGSNRLIWQLPDVGSPGNIYGYPMVEVPAMTDAPAAADQGFVFGNLKKGYAIGLRKGMRMVVNPWILTKENQTQFIQHMRIDGAVALSGALVEWISKS